MSHVSTPLHHLRGTRGLSLAQRLIKLKAELASLENELGESQKEGSPAFDDEEPVDVGAEIAEGNKVKKSMTPHPHVEPAELIKEVVDVKLRIEKIGKMKDGKVEREKLVSAVLQGTGEKVTNGHADEHENEREGSLADERVKEEGVPVKMEVRDVAEMDRRLGEIERAVGSSSTSIDEVCVTSNSGVLTFSQMFTEHTTSFAITSSPDPPQYPAHSPHSTSPHRQHLSSLETPSHRPGQALHHEQPRQ